MADLPSPPFRDSETLTNISPANKGEAVNFTGMWQEWFTKNKNQVDKNTTDISTNADDIADNASNIATVTADLGDHVDDTDNPHQTSDANLVVTDVTTNNASKTKHGFCPKLSDSATEYLNGKGLWSAVLHGGSFTMANDTSKTVADTNVTANSRIVCWPTNVAAAALEISSSKLYTSARNAGASFVVSTADSGTAAGSETYDYILFN